MNLALLALIIFCLLVGITGHGRWGPARAWSPFGIVLLIVIVLFLLGHVEIAEGQTLGTGEGTGLGSDGKTPTLTWSDDVPAWWVTLAAAVLALTQVAKAAIKSAKPAWWGKNVPRIIAVLLGLLGAVTAIPLPGAWWVEAIQGVLAGVLAVLGYDALAASDTGLRRIGPALLLCLAWPMVQCSGMGLEVSPRLPGYEVSDSEDDDDAVIDRARVVWQVDTNQGVHFRAIYTQGFGPGSFPALGCIEVLDSADRWIKGWCFACDWIDGFGACRLVDQPAPDTRIESGEGGE